MLVSLHGDERSESFDFDPAGVTWSRQSGQFVVGHPTGLNGKLAKVFIKKYPNKPSTAHSLMVTAAAENSNLPCTPRPIGYVFDNSNGTHYYFSEHLPEKYRLLEDLIKGGHQDPEALTRLLTNVLIDRNLGFETVYAAARLFANLNRRGFVYTDFTHKNIMIDRNSNSCLLIDLDSCIPTNKLPTKPAEMAGLGGQFSIVYWRAWHSWVGILTADMLSRTMVLSFAAVWARATALLRAGQSPEEVQRLLRGPSESDQAPLWRALKHGDQAAFAAYFALASSTPETSGSAELLFAQWQELFAGMVSGHNVPWAQIDAVCKATFEEVRLAPVKISKLNIPASRSGINNKKTDMPINPKKTTREWFDDIVEFDHPINRWQYIFSIVLSVLLSIYLSVVAGIDPFKIVTYQAAALAFIVYKRAKDCKIGRIPAIIIASIIMSVPFILLLMEGGRLSPERLNLLSALGFTNSFISLIVIITLAVIPGSKNK